MTSYSYSFTLEPGRSLGPFVLGSSIRSVLSMRLKNAQLKYNSEDPWANDICLYLVDGGISLLFDPHVQKLHTIDVCLPAKLCLDFRGTQFCNNDANIIPTFVRIYQLFGPTYPGTFEDGEYKLDYPGLSAIFPVPEAYRSLFSGSTSSSTTELPEEFPDGTTPVMTRLSIFPSSSSKSGSVNAAEGNGEKGKSKSKDSHIFTHDTTVVADSHIGITVQFQYNSTDNDNEKVKVKVKFGDSAQDVISSLGSPDSIFHKEDDKMMIHNIDTFSQQHQQNALGIPIGIGTFYNYRNLGLDIFITSGDCVSKIILRGAVPGHVDFGEYTRCDYNIRMKQGDSDDDDANATITSRMKWNDIKINGNGKMGKNINIRPVVSTKGIGDPFKPTHFYTLNKTGYIFEVIPESNAIASVTVNPFGSIVQGEGNVSVSESVSVGGGQDQIVVEKEKEKEKGEKKVVEVEVEVEESVDHEQNHGQNQNHNKKKKGKGRKK